MAEKKTYSKPYKKKEATAKAQYKPKHGKLAPLMTEEAKSTAGIHELSYDFGCRITRLFQYLTEDALVVHGSRLTMKQKIEDAKKK